MNRINPEKLLRSKWTAVEPKNQQRHFMVTRLIRGADDRVTQCELEAVINRQVFMLDWHELKNPDSWMMGWK